ncbi:MAG: type II toxin-antitoxin system RelE/ParE family toxin [Isosphaeraceae bacterium]
MAKALKTPRAQADLEAILDELESKSPPAAERFAARVDRKCLALGRNPELARARDEFLLGLRSTPVGKYVLFYRLRGEVVEVLRILHGRRDLGRILKEGA